MRRRTGLIVGGAVAVLLIGGAVWLALPRSTSAEDVALNYLRALESGDVDGVQATGLQISDEAAAAFAAASERLSDPRITSVTESVGSAVVAVSFTLAEEQRTVDITLTHDEGRWVPEPTTALGEVRIMPSTGGFVTAGDVTIATDARLSLLPAEYEFAAAPSDLLSGEATTVVLPGGQQDLEVTATLRPEATERAQDQLDDYLTDCTVAAADAPAHCGIQVPWAADLTSVSGIRYRIEQAPTLTLSETEFHADGGVLVATATGTAFDCSERSFTYRTQSWTVRGDVGFTDDDIVLAAW